MASRLIVLSRLMVGKRLAVEHLPGWERDVGFKTSWEPPRHEAQGEGLVILAPGCSVPRERSNPVAWRALLQRQKCEIDATGTPLYDCIDTPQGSPVLAFRGATLM